MAEHPIILVAAVSTADELNSYLSNIDDGASFLCIDDFDYTGELNGVSYKRCFIQGEIITYTTQYGFSYPAIQTPIQWRAWVADNFYSKSKIDSMITEKGAGKVKINDLDSEANYLKAKLGNGAGITFRVSSDNKKLVISLNTEVAPKLSSNGTWMYFDLDQNDFVDSGLKAEGTDGTPIHYVGEFVLNSTYQFNNAVRYQGKIYVANNEVQATVDPETDTENWEFLIKDGDKGDKGDKGDTGSTPNISFNKPTVSQTTGEPDITIEAAQGSTPENPVFNMAFTGIKGEKGDKGDTGNPGVDGTNFGYSNKYGSYELMVADLANIEEDSYVIINAGQDNGKVYQKKDDELQFIVNIIGPTGPQGDQGITGETGNGVDEVETVPSHEDGGENTVTLVMTDGSRHSFTVKNGSKGSPGKDFVIKKTYVSVAAMEADIDTIEVSVGDFVCITTGNVEDQDNAKLYVKAQDSNDQLFWSYITDLSGSQGIQGPAGQDGAAAGFASTMDVTVETKAAGTSAEVTVTPDSSTPNTAKKFNFTFKIPKGDTGDTGNGIAGTTIRYQNGSSGSTAPTGTWRSTPNPTPGTYLWTRIYFTFTGGGTATAYAVTYVPDIADIVFTDTIPNPPVEGTLYVI